MIRALTKPPSAGRHHQDELHEAALSDPHQGQRKKGKWGPVGEDTEEVLHGPHAGEPHDVRQILMGFKSGRWIPLEDKAVSCLEHFLGVGPIEHSLSRKSLRALTF